MSLFCGNSDCLPNGGATVIKLVRQDDRGATGTEANVEGTRIEET